MDLDEDDFPSAETLMSLVNSWTTKASSVAVVNDVSAYHKVL
jgi:hypothetical protein